MVRRRTRPRKKRPVYRGLAGAPAKRSGAWLILVLGALVVVNLYVFVWDGRTGVRAIRAQAEARTTPVLAVPSQPLDAPGSAAPSPQPRPPPARVITGTVGKAETLGKVLKKHGLTASEADEVIRALSGVLDFRTIRAGEAFRIDRGPDGRVVGFELELGKARRARVQRAASGELVGKLADGA